MGCSPCWLYIISNYSNLLFPDPQVIQELFYLFVFTAEYALKVRQRWKYIHLFFIVQQECFWDEEQVRYIYGSIISFFLYLQKLFEAKWRSRNVIKNWKACFMENQTNDGQRQRPFSERFNERIHKAREMISLKMLLHCGFSGVNCLWQGEEWRKLNGRCPCVVSWDRSGAAEQGQWTYRQSSSLPLGNMT